jgi:hypothetical protein
VVCDAGQLDDQGRGIDGVPDRARRTAAYAQTVLAGAWMETGFGDIDLEAVLDVLGQEFEGWPVAEVDRPNLPTADESIAACARWFQSEHRSDQ